MSKLELELKPLKHQKDAIRRLFRDSDLLRTQERIRSSRKRYKRFLREADEKYGLDNILAELDERIHQIKTEKSTKEIAFQRIYSALMHIRTKGALGGLFEYDREARRNEGIALAEYVGGVCKARNVNGVRVCVTFLDEIRSRLHKHIEKQKEEEKS